MGAGVTDRFPAPSTDVSCTCTASGGSSCPASGSGDIDEVIDLPVGGTVTFTAIATVDSAATTPSNLFSNTASVTTPVSLSDRLPRNNTAIDTNRLPGAIPLPSDYPGLTFSPPTDLDTEGEPGDVRLVLVEEKGLQPVLGPAGRRLVCAAGPAGFEAFFGAPDSVSNSLQVYDLASRSKKWEKRVTPVVDELDWTPSGDRIVTVHRGGRVNVWDAGNGSLVSELWTYHC